MVEPLKLNFVDGGVRLSVTVTNSDAYGLKAAGQLEVQVIAMLKVLVPE